MDGLIGIGGTALLLIAAGSLLGLLHRRRFSPRWLVAATLLLVLNDACLTRAYGLLPKLLPHATRNWQGQLLALALTLALAALPLIGWRRIGLTVRQREFKSALLVALAYCAAITALALALPNDQVTVEDVGFQLTLPGIQEEAFYRGLLLLCLDRAFTARWRFLGVDWGWGAILSSLLFGLAHAFGYSDGSFTFVPEVMALTALPSLVAAWVRLRTGSLLLPILMHNFGNVVTLFL